MSRRAKCGVLVWTLLLAVVAAASAGSLNAQAAPGMVGDLATSSRSSGAAAMVVDAASGRVLAQVGDVEAETLPGSAVKPFILRAALLHGVVNERTTVHCTGTLRVAGHNLACVHARDGTVLDAREALAESCNTYFATVARRMPPDVLVDALRSSGLRVGAAAADQVKQPDPRELMALGLTGVQASVREMAVAYRGLAAWMQSGDARARVVRDGLVASVESGAARAAYVDGITVAGKTGTVDEAGSGRSHGWFAGVVFGAGARPAWVLVVFVPRGNGRDAAALARRVLVRAR